MCIHYVWFGLLWIHKRTWLNWREVVFSQWCNMLDEKRFSFWRGLLLCGVPGTGSRYEVLSESKELKG